MTSASWGFLETRTDRSPQRPLVWLSAGVERPHQVLNPDQVPDQRQGEDQSPTSNRPQQDHDRNGRHSCAGVFQPDGDVGPELGEHPVLSPDYEQQHGPAKRNVRPVKFRARLRIGARWCIGDRRFVRILVHGENLGWPLRQRGLRHQSARLAVPGAPNRFTCRPSRFRPAGRF